jgi:hypothetical protein
MQRRSGAGSEHRQGGSRRALRRNDLDDAQRATQSKGDSRGAEGIPGADARLNGVDRR